MRLSGVVLVVMKLKGYKDGKLKHRFFSYDVRKLNSLDHLRLSAGVYVSPVDVYLRNFILWIRAKWPVAFSLAISYTAINEA